MADDDKTVKAGVKDLSYILVEAYDDYGNLAPLADNKISIKLNGAGKIACVGNGNPQSLNLFQSNSVDLFYGKAMIIIQSGKNPGELNVEVNSNDVGEAKVTIKMD